MAAQQMASALATVLAAPPSHGHAAAEGAPTGQADVSAEETDGQHSQGQVLPQLPKAQQEQQQQLRQQRVQASVSALDLSNTAWALARMGVAWPCALSRSGQEQQAEEEAHQEQAARAPDWPRARSAAEEDEVEAEAEGGERQGQQEQAGTLQSSGPGRPCSASMERSLAPLWPLLAAAVPALAPAMGPQEVANTLWALAHSGCELGPAGSSTARAAGQEAQPSGGQGGAEAAAGAGESAGAAASTAAASAASEALLARANQVMGTLSAQHAANIAWACASLGLRDEPLLQQLAGRASSLTFRCSAQGLAMLAWAYARLGVRHPGLVQAVLRAAKLKARRWVLQEVGAVTGIEWACKPLG